MTLHLETGPVPSQNELLRMHWAARRRVKQALAWELRAQVSKARPLERAHVEVTRLSVGVEPDPDNLVASAKLLLDAMVDAGIIKDDSPRHIELAVRWERAQNRRKQGARVKVTEVEYGQV